MSIAEQGRGSGDVSALLGRLEPELSDVLVRFRIPAQDCEDLLQDALLALLVQRDQVASPAPWLLATVRNRCRMYWRARRRRLLEAVDSHLLEELAGGVEATDRQTHLSHDLGCAISALPGHCRSILRLRYGLDRDSPEIAERLGYSPNSMRQVTNRCLVALSRKLLDAGFESRTPLPPPEDACTPAN